MDFVLSRIKIIQQPLRIKRAAGSRDGNKDSHSRRTMARQTKRSKTSEISQKIIPAKHAKNEDHLLAGAFNSISPKSILPLGGSEGIFTAFSNCRNAGWPPGPAALATK